METLYQTIQLLIERLDQLRDATNEAIANISTGGGTGDGTVPLHAPTHSSGGTDPVTVTNLAGYPGGITKFLRADKTFATPAGVDSLTQSFVTANAEPTLVNSRELIAGTNVTLDKTIPGQLTVNSSGGGGGALLDIEYLGDYTSGPTYDDGDIVIAADGIAYMCVKTTTTPPEPWPGIGIISSQGPPGPEGPPGPQGPAGTSPGVNATYWTVTSDPTLTNERALNALANGYVKSTGGEPSTVAVIPVTEGGTSATNAATARTNLGVGNVGTLNTTGNANEFLDGTGTFRVPPTTAGVPSGLIMLSFTPCPAGYTRVYWDPTYYFLRVGPTPGIAGGSNTHDHGAGSYVSADHAHGAGSYTAASHSHGGRVDISGNTSSNGAHNHSFSGSGSGTTGDNSAGVAGAGTASNVYAFSPHRHDFSVTISGNTGNVGDHSH